MLADILLNRINCRIVALTAANYKYAGQANLRYMITTIDLIMNYSKNSGSYEPLFLRIISLLEGADIFLGYFLIADSRLCSHPFHMIIEYDLQKFLLLPLHFLSYRFRRQMQCRGRMFCLSFALTPRRRL